MCRQTLAETFIKFGHTHHAQIIQDGQRIQNDTEIDLVDYPLECRGKRDVFPLSIDILAEEFDVAAQQDFLKILEKDGYNIENISDLATLSKDTTVIARGVFAKSVYNPAFRENHIVIDILNDPESLEAA